MTPKRSASTAAAGDRDETSGAAGLYALPCGRARRRRWRGWDRSPTTTSNPYSFLGRAVVTGGATAPDGRRVVLLRTYADAFEFDVTGGDVVAALTTGAAADHAPA